MIVSADLPEIKPFMNHVNYYLLKTSTCHIQKIMQKLALYLKEKCFYNGRSDKCKTTDQTNNFRLKSKNGVLEKGTKLNGHNSSRYLDI